MKFVLTLSLISFLCLFSVTNCQTLYDYYINGTISSGLRADGDHFYLNGKQMTILSGSVHYFRIHPNNWRPVLKKVKAAGLNAVDFYSPWNLHEETPGNFDFESEFLNLTDFLVAIREADLFAVYRPGPFICAEWDFGGLPAWLLRDPKMKIRSNYKPYIDAVDNYWRSLFEITRRFQFTSSGGPIIAVQIENELGSYGNTLTKNSDAVYMTILGNIARKYGISEMLFTSDGPGRQGSLDIYEKAVNFKRNALNNLQLQKKAYPNKPLFVGEYWSGWFDNWGGRHNTQNVSYFSEQFEQIVLQMNASINIYMFIGGTNFGFMAGNVGRPDQGAVTASVITSYDYDAPLSESGNYTQKYWKTKQLIEKFRSDRNIPEPHIQIDVPETNRAVKYGSIDISQQLSLNSAINKLTPYLTENPISMENINIGPNYGQNFGFTLYRTTIPKWSKTITFTRGRVNDRAAVIVSNRQIDFIYAKNNSFDVRIPENVFNNSLKTNTLDILVENMGRVDYGPTLNDMDIQRKGLFENVLIDRKLQKNWKLYSLDFKPKFIKKLLSEKWEPIADYKRPTFYRTDLLIDGNPEDTYLKLPDWTTSVVFINGFNVGRYWNVGPAKTLYVPAPLLRRGINEIIVFETQGKGSVLEFVDKPILE